MSEREALARAVALAEAVERTNEREGMSDALEQILGNLSVADTDLLIQILSNPNLAREVPEIVGDAVILRLLEGRKRPELVKILAISGDDTIGVSDIEIFLVSDEIGLGITGFGIVLEACRLAEGEARVGLVAIVHRSLVGRKMLSSKEELNLAEITNWFEENQHTLSFNPEYVYNRSRGPESYQQERLLVLKDR